MGQVAENNKIYEFADFRLIPGEELLLRNGTPVNLNPKAFAMLTLLVERHGHLVSKSEINDAIWEGSFVEEGVIPKAVWFVRNALGDTSKERFIQTVPRRGYRFVAPVSILNEASEAPAISEFISTGYRLPVMPENDGIDPNLISQKEGPNTNGGSDVVTLKTAATSGQVDGSVEDAILFEEMPDTSTQRRSLAWAAYAGIVAVLLGGVALYLTLGGRNILGKGDSRRIAVLPFKPVDVERRDLIYELGIAETLILKLGTDKKLSVRQLNAVRSYVDVNEDPLKAGKEQNVDYVLSSNYQIANGKIKVTSHLLDVATGKAEDTFTSQKDSADAFAAQDAIANELGNGILARFGSDRKEFRTRRGTDNEEAYDNYQQAMTLFDQQRPGSIQKAIEYLDRAVELDPNYAKGWAGKAIVSSLMPNTNRSSDSDKQYQLSMQAAKRALGIDPNVSEAYTALCDNKFAYEYDFQAAEADCKRAIELDPNSSSARRTYAILLNSRGRFDEGSAEIKTALELEPVSLRNQRIFANGLYMARRYGEAIEVYERLIDLNPDVRATHLWYIRALEESDREAEALEILIRMLTLDKKDNETIERVKAAYASSGWQGVLRERIKIEMQEPSPNYSHISEFYGFLGDKDKAIEFLQKWSQKRSWLMMFLRVDPRFDPLRDDPRFADLIRQVEGT